MSSLIGGGRRVLFKVLVSESNEYFFCEFYPSGVKGHSINDDKDKDDIEATFLLVHTWSMSKTS